MKQRQFEGLYAGRWQRFERLVSDAELQRGDTALDLVEFSQLYRKVCHFHSLAKERQYSSYLVDTLGELIVRGHQQLYKKKTAYRHKFIQFFLNDFPVLLRKEWKLFWLSTALFYLPGLVYFAAILLKPELVYSFMDTFQVYQFEEMYDPDNRILGEARESETNWMMFGYYIQNNISVAFNCFASGIVFGLGSLYFLVFNSLYFGAVAAHLVNVGYTTTFFTFVVGHGSFELTAITIAGAAGLKIGLALLSPGNISRLEALKRAAKVAVNLIYGVIAMLAIAAFIEAFWSSNNSFYPWQKYLIGGLLWFIVVIYFAYVGKPASEKSADEHLDEIPGGTGA